MQIIHDTSMKTNLALFKTDYKRVPTTAMKRYSPSRKRINLRNKLKVVDRVRQTDMISNPNKYPEHSNVESRTLTSSKLTGFASSRNTVIEENCKKEHQDQASRDVRSSSDNWLFRYPYIQRNPEKDKGTQDNSRGAGSRSTKTTLNASKCPLFVNQICDYTLSPDETQPLLIHRNHIQHLIREIQRIPNLPTFTHNFPEPLIQNYNIKSTTSFAIQNPTNKNNQLSNLEIPKSSLVIQEHPKVLQNQKTLDHTSEVECATSEPTTHSKVTSALHTSIVSTNSAEHKDSAVEDMDVEAMELTEASCIEQNVFSRTRAENTSSANPKALKEANRSEQTVESSMEVSPMVEAVMLSEISLPQGVDDDDEQSNSSELNSDEIITTSSNSNEQANQSVTSELNQADVCADKVFEIFQIMKSDSSAICQIAYDVYRSLVQSQRVIECISNESENLRTLKKGKVAVVTSKEVTAKVQQIAEVNQAERKKEENLDVSMKEDKKKDNDVDSKSIENNDDCGGDIKDAKDQDRDNKDSKTTRGHIRTFVLPPEYDPHDSRWTLKYRENEPELNLVELVPGCNVFINSIRLAHCTRSARDCKALARRLLEEIFTRSALSVCSLTGVRANAFDISGTNVRPGLDANARMAILTFVEKYTSKKKWGAFDLQSVVNTLRSKIQDIRAKHGKTA